MTNETKKRQRGRRSRRERSEDGRKDERTCLALGREEVNHFLDGSGPVHVQRDVDEVLRDRLADDVPLLVRGVLQKLLAEVVPKRI